MGIILLRRVDWLIFGLLPTISLTVLMIAAVFATVVLDHHILGRNADGWPVLYKTPLLREAVDVFHASVMCVLPVLVAIGFLRVGARHGARRLWVVSGGALACLFGSLWLINAAWTGVKGTSDLVIGIEVPWVIGARLAASLVVYALAVRMTPYAQNTSTA